MKRLLIATIVLFASVSVFATDAPPVTVDVKVDRLKSFSNIEIGEVLQSIRAIALVAQSDANTAAYQSVQREVMDRAQRTAEGGLAVGQR